MRDYDVVEGRVLLAEAREADSDNHCGGVWSVGWGGGVEVWALSEVEPVEEMVDD